MADWTHLMIHCSDTPPRMDVNRTHIENWHLNQNGWSRVGYSIFWERDGRQDILIEFDNDDVIESWEISNGAAGWNGRTKHVCYAGGRAAGGGPEDNRTEGQNRVMEATVKLLVMLYPQIKLIGHNQVSPTKYCPSFNVPEWAQSIGIDDRNIDFHNYAGNPHYGIGA